VGARLAERWLPALRARRLPKRAAEISTAELQGVQLPEWVSGDTAEKRRWEDSVAAELDLQPGEVLLDFPIKAAMFQLDVLVERKGVVVRVGPDGMPGLMDLPRVARELYGTARVLRLFTFERREVSPEWLVRRLQSWEGGAGGRDLGPVEPVQVASAATDGCSHTS
jgi:hypothetical protein